MRYLLGTVLDNQFRITGRKSVGRNGELYSARDLRNHRVMVKVERRLDNGDLSNEIGVYRQLQYMSGHPTMYGSGIFRGRRYLVLDRLGNDLQHMLLSLYGQFCPYTVAMVVIQLLHRLEWVHHRGFVHRDINLRNIIVGDYGNINLTKLYLIDFGSAGKFRDSAGRHIPEGRLTRRVSGTLLYASIRWHGDHVQSRRDDLLSLAYCMVYMCKGELPWEQCSDENEVYTMKKRISSTNLCRGMPSEMLELYRYIRGLHFDQRPDYHLLRQLMREFLSNQGIDDESSFEWV